MISRRTICGIIGVLPLTQLFRINLGIQSAATARDIERERPASSATSSTPSSSISRSCRRRARGLAALERAQADRSHDVALEVDLLMTLGLVIKTAEGYAAAEVHRAFARARELCRELNDPVRVVPILIALAAPAPGAVLHRAYASTRVRCRPAPALGRSACEARRHDICRAYATRIDRVRLASGRHLAAAARGRRARASARVTRRGRLSRPQSNSGAQEPAARFA